MSQSPGVVKRWVLAARPRTLPAAIVPVAIGAALVRPHRIDALNTVLCAVVALTLQIGTNYANDYADGIRGTDEKRVGPFRLTASKLVPAWWVKVAAFKFFAYAALAGVLLASRTSWWLVPIGVSAVLAGWFYTGGPKPYGYMGLGELFVLTYFGLVATVGTAYVQGRTVPPHAWAWGVATGAMACALLEANNIRDIDGDRLAQKRTLAARLGRGRASYLYGFFVLAIVAATALSGAYLVALVAVLAYVPALRLVFSPRTGRELLPVLQSSARAQLLLGVVSVVTLSIWP